jgi:hypothetical protein
MNNYIFYLIIVAIFIVLNYSFYKYVKLNEKKINELFIDAIIVFISLVAFDYFKDKYFVQIAEKTDEILLGNPPF